VSSVTIVPSVISQEINVSGCSGKTADTHSSFQSDSPTSEESTISASEEGQTSQFLAKCTTISSFNMHRTLQSQICSLSTNCEPPFLHRYSATLWKNMR